MSRKNRDRSRIAPATDATGQAIIDDQATPDSELDATLPVSADPDQTQTQPQTWHEFVNSPSNPLTPIEQDVQDFAALVKEIGETIQAIAEELTKAEGEDAYALQQQLDEAKHDHAQAIEQLAKARNALAAQHQQQTPTTDQTQARPEAIITQANPVEPPLSEVAAQVANARPAVDAATAAATTPEVDLDADQPPNADVASRRIWYFHQIATTDNGREALANRCDVQCGHYLFHAITEGLAGIDVKQHGKTARLIFADFVTHFTARTNRSPRPHDWLAAHALFCAVNEESQALILADDTDPFPNSTLSVLARWLDLNTKAEPHVLGSIRPGFEQALNDMVQKVHTDGLTAKATAAAMDAVELAHATANASQITDATERKQAQSEIKQKQTADRNKKVKASLETVAKTVLEHKVKPSELISKLKDEGALPADFAGGYDAATITVQDAERFARSLVEADRADIIHVMLTVLQAYAATANATTKTSPAARPELNGAKPQPPRIPTIPRLTMPSVNAPAPALAGA